MTVDKNSMKIFCEKITSLEAFDKLLKVILVVSFLSEFILYNMQFLAQQASFNIRNLKRSTIKELYSKEKQKRKNQEALFQSATTKPQKQVLKENMNAFNSSLEDNNLLPVDYLKSPSPHSKHESSQHKIFLDETNTSILSHSHVWFKVWFLKHFFYHCESNFEGV